MKTIQVNELTDKQLDEFCARARKWHRQCGGWYSGNRFGKSKFMVVVKDYSPTSDTQAGKAQLDDLIERFEVATVKDGEVWLAIMASPLTGKESTHCYASLRRIAVTRVVVASVFGNEVEVEDE